MRIQPPGSPTLIHSLLSLQTATILSGDASVLASVLGMFPLKTIETEFPRTMDLSLRASKNPHMNLSEFLLYGSTVLTAYKDAADPSRKAGTYGIADTLLKNITQSEAIRSGRATQSEYQAILQLAEIYGTYQTIKPHIASLKAILNETSQEESSTYPTREKMIKNHKRHHHTQNPAKLLMDIEVADTYLTQLLDDFACAFEDKTLLNAGLQVAQQLGYQAFEA